MGRTAKNRPCEVAVVSLQPQQGVAHDAPAVLLVGVVVQRGEDAARGLLVGDGRVLPVRVYARARTRARARAGGGGGSLDFLGSSLSLLSFASFLSSLFFSLLSLSCSSWAFISRHKE